MMTINRAIEFLRSAAIRVGGDKVLILSLTGSELEEVDVTDMVLITEGESRYVQVRASHPALQGDQNDDSVDN